MAEGGPLGFYRGLSAALLRQIFYTTTRLGMYKTVFAEVQKRNKEQGRSKCIFMKNNFLLHKKLDVHLLLDLLDPSLEILLI